jgi:hypothetical protein
LSLILGSLLSAIRNRRVDVTLDDLSAQNHGTDLLDVVSTVSNHIARYSMPDLKDIET